MTADTIRVGANGQVYAAPVGTAFPTDPSTNPPAPWMPLGRNDENGVALTDSKTVADIGVWQSMYPARKIITARAFETVFNLRDWTQESFALAFGGGTWSTTGGITKYTPPSPQQIDVRALFVVWQDGGYHYAFGVPQGMVAGNVQTKLVRNAAADLPITFDAVGLDGEDPWFFLTDDPAFEVPSGAWAATHAYALDTVVSLGEGTIEATTAGTSGAVAPTLPDYIGETVDDGTVVWTRVS